MMMINSHQIELDRSEVIRRGLREGRRRRKKKKEKVKGKGKGKKGRNQDERSKERI
jgi:Arc/MetJ-type ribon-helix-helix transcriptional regulator